MTNKQPVNIRRNVEDYDDPYKPDQSLPESSVCKRCGDVYMSGRWYSKDQVPAKRAGNGEKHMTVCPACRKQSDKMPGGVLKMTGDFLRQHKEEIINLIRNEVQRAQNLNPLERIISMDWAEGNAEITTTNEKLVQRIGKALHKAYSGDIVYQFSRDTKLARVNWRRE